MLNFLCGFILCMSMGNVDYVNVESIGRMVNNDNQNVVLEFHEMRPIMAKSNSEGEYYEIVLIYKGNATPSLTYDYQREMNGVMYKGTLKLLRSEYRKGVTSSKYGGYMYPVE